MQLEMNKYQKNDFDFGVDRLARPEVHAIFYLETAAAHFGLFDKDPAARLGR